MSYVLCNEKKIGITLFALFIIIISFGTLFGISPLLHSIFKSSVFITLITGLIISLIAIRNIGVKNFAGKSFFCFGIASAVTLINSILSEFNFNFHLSEYLWIMVSLFITTGIYFLLTTYKLTLPRYLLLEIIYTFLILFLTTIIFFGFTQVLNLILITTGIAALRISGKRTHCFIILLSLGVILLSVSNILFIHRHWNQISYFGDISDVTFLISWISIVLGIYFTKKHHAQKNF